MGETAPAPDGRLVFAECVASHVCVHDVGGVSCVVSAGEHLYSASAGTHLIRVWDLPDLRPTHQFGHGGARGAHLDLCSVKAIALLLQDHTLFTAHQDHKIRVWKCSTAASGANAATAHLDKPAHHRLVATLPSLKDRFWKSLSQSNYVQVRRHHKKLWIQHSDTISALALGGGQNTQQVLYSASWDKTVKVWRTSDLKCLESIRAHDDAVNALAVCEKSGTLYTGSADGKVKAWASAVDDKQRHRHCLLATMEGAHHKAASVNAVALSESGELLFSAGSDGALAVWGRKKGEEHASKLLHKRRGCHAQAILCLCVCKLKEEDILLTGSADKTVRVWLMEFGGGGSIGLNMKMKMACVGVLQGHAGAVKSICVAPSGDPLKRIVGGGGCLVYSGGADKSIKAWCLSTCSTSLKSSPR